MSLRNANIGICAGVAVFVLAAVVGGGEMSDGLAQATGLAAFALGIAVLVFLSNRDDKRGIDRGRR